MSQSHQISRRDLLASAAAIALAPAAAIRAQTSPVPFRVRTLNHVALGVSNIQRSVEFYQRLFGLPVLTYVGGRAPLLRVGSGSNPQMIGMTDTFSTTGVDHFCLGIDNFSPERVMKVLGEHAIKGARVSLREGVPELYCLDPDSINVQIQDVTYCGGSGPLGDICDPKLRPLPPNIPVPPRNAAFRVRTINHVTLACADSNRSLQFYQRLFGTPILTYQGNTPLLRVGAGEEPHFIRLLGNQKTPSIHQICFGIEDFNPDRVMKTLTEQGVKDAYINVREGVPELRFPDPDSITLQIQDASYCGGSGPLGNMCDPTVRSNTRQRR